MVSFIRFIPVIAKMQGARITQVDVKHHPRKFGKSKYGIGRTFRVLSDLVLMLFFRRYIQKPMHLFGTIGFISLGIGIIINLYLLILKILGHDIWGQTFTDSWFDILTRRYSAHHHWYSCRNKCSYLF
jgi:hypothetical protein